MRQTFIGQRNLFGESSANTSGIWGLRDILTMRLNDYLFNPSDTAGTGLFGAGQTVSGPLVNVIDYITIATLGNAIDFGDLYSAYHLGAAASATRAVWAGEWSAGNRIDYVTISSTGNSTDFGDLTLARGFLEGCGSSTRGLFGGGYYSSSYTNVIDYITFASEGNAIDFGDLTTRRYNVDALSSSIRGVFAGGSEEPIGGNPAAQTNTIDYVTIASLGNAVDFGDRLATGSGGGTGMSSQTRGVYLSGTNSLEYITIASTGNAIDFGDTLSTNFTMACSSKIRGILSGTSYTNTIEYITIAVLGNSVDFGDLTVGRNTGAACSSNHGGI